MKYIFSLKRYPFQATYTQDFSLRSAGFFLADGLYRSGS